MKTKLTFTCLVLFGLIAVFSACKKEKLTTEEWMLLANDQLKEMEQLTADIPCEQQSDVTIEEFGDAFSCHLWYFPVAPSIKTRFVDFRDRFLQYRSNYVNAIQEKGGIVEICFDQDMSFWTDTQPVRVDCVGGNVKLITTENIDLEEAESLVVELYEQIKHYKDTVTCTGDEHWYHTAVIGDGYDDFEDIPYTPMHDYATLKKVLSTYNSLKFRILKEKGDVGYVNIGNRIPKVECVDGKPVIRYEKQ